METFDLSNDLEGSTPLPAPPAEETATEKNVDKTIKKMDSTPINDVMSGPADWETQSQMSGPPPPPPPQQFMMNQQPQMTPPPTAPKPNPFNLTDEQMTALLVGVAAALASSKMVQEKLASMIPQVGSDPHGLLALGVTGLVAVIIFYFANRVM